MTTDDQNAMEVRKIDDRMLFDCESRPLWKCRNCGTIQPVTTKHVSLARECLGCGRKLVPQTPVTIDQINQTHAAARSLLTATAHCPKENVQAARAELKKRMEGIT